MATEHDNAPQGTKRSRDELETDDGVLKPTPTEDSESEDDDLGPALPPSADQAPKKKRRKLPYERQYVAALPSASRYSKSLMHKEQLAYCTFTPNTDFLITTSVDGYVKFWKKTRGGIEFVKEFKAHDGAIKSTTVSVDGRKFATAGAEGDDTIKIFDVETFDLLAMLKPETASNSVCFVHGSGSTFPLLAVSSALDGRISIYDGRGENDLPLHTIKKLHKSSVHIMVYNNLYDCVVSLDESGMVEYWRPSGDYNNPLFETKAGTGLYEFKKAKSVPCSVTVSPTGKQFATFSFPDRKVRIFEFATGKLYRTYDESIETITSMQQAGEFRT